ncbi:hypothetical protein [Streptomyces sp. NPDC005573]|uniref:hypothetical protein n=1 Tax=Streptomyces sp. NPDC005573 TaxID=3156890 RepID=UPI0033AF2807
MNMTDESPGTAPDPRSATIQLPARNGARVRVQPVPSAAARIISADGRGLAQDRLRLLSRYGYRCRQAMAVVAAQVSPETWNSGGSLRNNRVTVLADLAAVRLYLTEEWKWLDEAVLEGTTGEHLALARCVASGLRRLPSYRGPAAVRAGTVGMVADWYRENRFIVDHGFWSASASAAALGEDEPGFLVWSLTARRTGAVDPYAPERLIFPPGTRFKVLRTTEGQHPIVMMRELFPQEPAVDTPASSGSKHTTWLDESTVAELERLRAEPSARILDGTGPRGRLPGLIVTPEARD